MKTLIPWNLQSLFDQMTDNKIWFLIIGGALLGATKTGIQDSRKMSICQRILDILVGMFAGTLLAAHFSSGLTFWLSGLLALAASSLAVGVIDAVREIAPKITKRLLIKRLGIDECKKDS